MQDSRQDRFNVTNIYGIRGELGSILKAKVTKPVTRGLKITGGHNEKHWIEFKYERIPTFSYYCGFIGHDDQSCKRRYKDELDGVSKGNLYGANGVGWRMLKQDSGMKEHNISHD